MLNAYVQCSFREQTSTQHIYIKNPLISSKYIICNNKTFVCYDYKLQRPKQTLIDRATMSGGAGAGAGRRCVCSFHALHKARRVGVRAAVPGRAMRGRRAGLTWLRVMLMPSMANSLRTPVRNGVYLIVQECRENCFILLIFNLIIFKTYVCFCYLAMIFEIIFLIQLECLKKLYSASYNINIMIVYVLELIMKFPI